MVHMVKGGYAPRTYVRLIKCTNRFFSRWSQTIPITGIKPVHFWGQTCAHHVLTRYGGFERRVIRQVAECTRLHQCRKFGAYKRAFDFYYNRGRMCGGGGVWGTGFDDRTGGNVSSSKLTHVIWFWSLGSVIHVKIAAGYVFFVTLLSLISRSWLHFLHLLPVCAMPWYTRPKRLQVSVIV